MAARAVLAFYDVDHDGLVSAAEFKQGTQRMRVALQRLLAAAQVLGPEDVPEIDHSTAQALGRVDDRFQVHSDGQSASAATHARGSRVHFEGLEVDLVRELTWNLFHRDEDTNGLLFDALFDPSATHGRSHGEDL